MPCETKFLLSIVLPVYNEETYIDAVLERLFAVPFPAHAAIEVIAVDDASTDRTYERLLAWRGRGVIVARHEKNQGKGAALHTGFALATGAAIAVQDADFEYDPADLPQLLEQLIRDRLDIIFGARLPLMKNGPKHQMRFAHRFINQFLTRFCNLFLPFRLSDMECCYKLFRTPLVKRLSLRENRFGFEPEITLKAARLGVRTAEAGVSYACRSFAEGKKINWKDGVSALRCILAYGLFRAD